MNERINLDSFLENHPNYPLRPCMFNLRSDKIIRFQIGLDSSPEGWWDCSSYMGKDGSYVTWMEMCWEVKNEPDCKLYFWVRILSFIGNPPVYNRPTPLKADAFHFQVVDSSIPSNVGYGKEFVQGLVYSVDDMFKWISEHTILSPFFFTEKEKKNMVFNQYKDR